MKRRGAMIKQISIIAATMALTVAASTAMAEPQKRSVVDKATHRAKAPRPSKTVPNSYEDKLRQYEEDKRNGWYKIDSS
jgi:hypothetical protein